MGELNDPTLPYAIRYQTCGLFDPCSECIEGEERDYPPRIPGGKGWPCRHCDGEGTSCRGCGEPPSGGTCFDLPDKDEQEAFERWVTRHMISLRREEYLLLLELFRREREA